MARVLRKHRATFVGVGLFSGLINVLALSGPLYMLQVYDRVLPSRSVPTLVGLSILLVILYGAQGLLDLVRTRLTSRIGLRLERSLRGKVLAGVLILPLWAKPGGDGLQPVRDLDSIRMFLSGPGPTAFSDMPWIPLYLALIFLLHPVLGLFALGGAVALVGVTLITEMRTSGPLRAAAHSGAARLAFGEAARRNAAVIRAMGMAATVQRAWSDLSIRHHAEQLTASDAAGGLMALSKVLRMLLQSGMLGLAAYYAIQGEVTAGTIIAASIVMSRALAPVELAIAHWRGFVAARQGWQRLGQLFAALPQDAGLMALPRPSKLFEVQGLNVAAPGHTTAIIRNVTFALNAGAGLGIIGPSASGKSTLARALVGAWQPMTRGGAVRLDGATLDQYDVEALGRDIGYLPQNIELFDATIAANIARLAVEPESSAVIAAAQLAGVHDMILRFPEGYNTRLGEGGSVLSAGQRQRLALARALYRDPFLVVLDEPNSNLDSVGDAALTQAILSVRRRGGIVVVIAHRRAALASVDQLLVLSHGQVQAFGPKEEVLRRTTEPPPPPAPVLRVVSDGSSGEVT